jgi:hypothetical protein
MSVWPAGDERSVVLERVDARAREIQPGRVARGTGKAILALITNVLFCLGYVSARTLRFGWQCIAWICAAVAEGFAEGIRARERGRPD